MSREETVQILSLLKAAYPNFYKGMTRPECNGVISVWSTQFTGIPVQIVLMAVNKLISVNTFPPTVAEVKSKLKSLYYEAVAELLTGADMSKGNQQKLTAILKYCQDSIPEPSLMSMIDDQDMQSRTNVRCGIEGKRN